MNISAMCEDLKTNMDPHESKECELTLADLRRMNVSHIQEVERVLDSAATVSEAAGVSAAEHFEIGCLKLGDRMIASLQDKMSKSKKADGAGCSIM